MLPVVTKSGLKVSVSSPDVVPPGVPVSSLVPSSLLVVFSGVVSPSVIVDGVSVPWVYLVKLIHQVFGEHHYQQVLLFAVLLSVFDFYH